MSIGVNLFKMLVGSDYTVLRSHSLHLLYPPLPFPFLPSFPPLEVGPKFSYRGVSHGERQRCKLHSGVWAEPQPKSNSVHLSLKMWHLVTAILRIFLRINLRNLHSAF